MFWLFCLWFYIYIRFHWSNINWLIRSIKDFVVWFFVRQAISALNVSEDCRFGQMLWWFYRFWCMDEKTQAGGNSAVPWRFEECSTIVLGGSHLCSVWTTAEDDKKNDPDAIEETLKDAFSLNNIWGIRTISETRVAFWRARWCLCVRSQELGKFGKVIRWCRTHQCYWVRCCYQRC